MSDDPDLLYRLYLTMDRNRKEARNAYKEAFGHSADHQKIDDELVESLRAQISTLGTSSIIVPARIVIGLLLRPARWSGRGRRRPPKERWAKRQADLAVRSASKRWAELVRDGMHSKQAKDQAATEMQPLLRDEFEFAGLGLSTLKRRMSLTKGQRDLDEL